MFRSGYKTLLVLLFILAGSVPLAAYYYFPDNQPPGPPPNYNQIDPEHFYGVPPMDEMIHRDGYFVYYDSSESLWTINSVIPSGTPAFEQFHGAILVQLEEEPAPGVNVFPLGFDLTSDLHRNDRWGWSRWPDSIAPDLYEIWWDITIDCPGALIGCSRTIGFWKTHAGFGPQDDFITPLLPVWLGTPGGKKSFFVDSAELAEDILSEDVYGDASNGITKLYAQLLGAKLNILSGASDIDVTGVISAADAFLAEHDWRDWDNLSAQEQMTVLDWKDTLDDYNNGYIGPGHCDDFPEDSVLTGDSICFIGISFDGCAFDFNLWGSGYNRTFDADHVFLGRYMEPLGHIIDFEDTFEGIYDPYGHPFDCDSTNDIRAKRREPDNDCLEPNLSVFTRVTMPGASYNYDGMIETGNEYGNTYGGSRVYNGNGIQFGVYDCEENNPPTFEPPVGFLKPMTLCLGSTVYDTIIANDFDPDDTVTVFKVSGPGDFSSTPDVPPVYGYFTWTPIAEGQYVVVFQATDQHGATVIDSVVYTITFDQPPMAHAEDTTMFICWDTDEVCYTVTADDAEDDPLTFILLSGAGNMNAETGELCLTPGGEGQYPFVVEVADSCGSDTVDFTVSILANRDPVIVPYDSIIAVCDVDTVCFPVDAFDPDAGDILEITFLDGPGSFAQTGNTGGLHCFLPDSVMGGRYVFHFQVTDECWREAIANGAEPSDPPRDSVVIILELNQPPEITCPGDQFEFLCDPDTLCYDIFASDPDGDELLYAIVSGPGYIDPATGRYCLYADTEGSFFINVSVTDTCGNFDTCSFNIVIDLNRPPAADIADTTIELCGLGEVCIPYTVFDPDDNIVDFQATNEQGEVVTVQNGYLCFTPDDPGVYPISIAVTDACGEIGMDQAVVTVILIEDVSIACPPEPFMISLCEPDTICVDVPVSPPDAALTLLEPGATYADGKLCTYVEETGVYIFTLVATGECNTDTCRVIINAGMDEPPVVSCPAPGPVHLCGPDSVSVPLTVSPASAIVSITPRAIHADGQLTFYADSPGEYVFTVVAENACGADTCSFPMTVTFDSPPHVTIADSAFHLCELQEVCVPYEYSDPDENIVNVRISPLKTLFKLAGGYVCFTPPDSGTYELVLTVTDSCGLSASDTATVVVTLNEPPSVVVGDTAIFTCDSADICLPVTAIDSDGTITSIEVESPAYYDDVNGVVCLPITGSGTYRIGVVAHDDCGAAAVDTGIAIVTFNSPPEATAPIDTVVSLCNPQEICLDGFDVFDIDDNILSIEFNPDIGAYEAGTYCFMPDTAGTYCLVITVTDACGETAEDTVCVIYELGSDVVIDCPDAIKIQNLCGADSVCHNLPPISPPDAMVTVLEPGAIIADGKLCFYAEASGTYTYTLVASGECGSDTCVLEIPVAIYEPPQVTCPPSDSVHLCGPDSIAVPLMFTPESAQFSVTPPGTYDNGQFKFYAAEPGEYCFTAVAENECGADTCTFCITVTFDSPPQVALADSSIHLCEFEQICIPVDIFDPDGNIADIEVSPPDAVLIDDSICFTPTGDGIYEVSVTVTDSCGNFVSGTVAITVTLNQQPFVDVVDTSLFVCNFGLLMPICLPVSFGDPDGVIDSIVVTDPAYYDADNQQVCLEVDESGTYTVSITVYDDCGASANDVGTMTVTFNSAPTALMPADTSVFLCEPVDICIPVEYDDIDGNIEIVEIIPSDYALMNDTVCVIADAGGLYEMILRVTDSCGVAAEDTMKITVSLNQPPTVTVGDSTLFVCEPTTVCLPVDAFDPDGVIDSIIGDPPAYYDDVNGRVCLPVEESGSFDVIVTVYDDCGVPAEAAGTITITINSPPIVTAPPDTSVFLCEPTEICIDGFSITDPDDNIASVVFEPDLGIYADGRYCFTPASAGQYCFAVRVADDCDITVEDTVCVTVELGDNVVLTCPDTQHVSLCGPDSVCADISYSPPTANIHVVEPGAVFGGNRLCFYAEVSGIYTYTVIASGDCGEDTCQVVLDVMIEEQPGITCPPSDTVHLCTPDSIAVPINFLPESALFAIAPDGAYENGVFTFYADVAGEYCFEAIASNECGADTCNFCVTVTMDSPPQIAISDSSLFLCAPEEICIPYEFSDPDGNIADISVTPADYVLVNGTVCFTPPGPGAYEIVLTVTDSCGNSAADTAIVDIALNQPPTVAMNDTTVYLCEPTDICIPVLISDPENAIDSVVVDAPAHYDAVNGVVCLPVDAGGSYPVAVAVYDHCGETAAASAMITVVLDSPPQVTCPEPGVLHLCAPDSISVPLAISPGGANITITPPASYADGQLTFFAEGDGDYCFEVIADNSCGADTCSFCITVTVDAPPQVTIADSSVYLCDPEEICIPYSYFDPDDNVVSVTVEPSRYSVVEGFVCFTPPAAGEYDIILTVADSCGNSDVDTATVQVTLNQPPTVDVADTAVFLCEPADVCLPITFSDPDGAVDSVVAGVPAYYDADNQRICFPVTVSGQFEVPATVYDTCGATATASGIIIAAVNSSPSVTVPNDTSMILCDTVEICLGGFAFSDFDNNLDLIEFIPDIGLYGGGEYCFTPDTAGTYCLVARATDSCGAFAEDTVCVAIDWGENAVIDCPAGPVADTICEPDSICIPVSVQPFDAKVDILEPEGIYVNGELCFYADSAGIYVFTVVATGECDADTCPVTVDVTLDEAPVIICPTPDPIFLCEPDSVSIPLTMIPPTADVIITPPAVYENGQLRFYADKEGDICFEVIASAICGADTCEFCVTVSLNDPPAVRVPDTAIALCDLQEVCIPVDYSDPDGNIRSIVIEPHTYTMINDSICFTPAGEGRYEIIVTITDSCDVQAVDTGIIDIYLNVRPTVAFGQLESPLYLCDLEQICVPVTIDDPDNNIISVIGGNTCDDPVIYNTPDSLCWTPTTFGTCTLTVIVEDICGESDTAVAEIVLIDAPDPNPPCIPDDTVVVCDPGQVCIDLPVIEGEHYFLVKPDIYTIFPQTNTICWIASENRTDTISIIDSTLCGVDSCSFVLTTFINRPPEITAEGPVDTAFCHSTTLCIDYTVIDPDGNIDTILVSGTCPEAVVDIVNSRVCLDLAEAIDCVLHLVVRDECGLADTALVPIAAVPNRPPNINPPSIETVVRCETDTSAIVIADICVSDPDFDAVILVLDSGLGEFSFDPLFDCGELTFTPPTNDTAEYCFKFKAADYCDTVFELFCVNVLPSAVCSTCVEVAIKGPPCVNSGGRAIVAVTAETFNSIGGYDLLIGYDASALSFIRADLGLGISGWEYFTYRFADLGNCEAPCPSGLLRLVAIADINNGPFHPPIEELSPNGSIASITFRVTSDLNFGGHRIPVNFFWMDCPDNGFSDPTGQYFYVDHIIFSPEGNIVWDELNDAVYPEADRPPHVGTPDDCLVGDKYTPVRCVSFHNGEVCIQHPDSVDKRGDMNLNGVQYEIADAVVYTNYFIRGLDAFAISVAGQIAASDVNADGMTLSIGDLVYLIRVIIGDAPPYPKPLIESEVATASLTQRDGEATVRMESTYDVGGVLMVFDGHNIKSAIPMLADDAAHMNMKYGWLAGNLRVLLYSMEPGGKIAAGAADLVKLHLPDDGTVELMEIEMADYFGRMLTTDISNAALPNRLYLTQNRPNPFNPNTTFELALPKASEYALTIYNITGQVIRRWTGYAEAGYVSFEWDGRDQNGGAVASGVYFYRAEALGQDTIRKMVLIK